MSIDRTKPHALCQCGSILVDTEHFRGRRWICMTCGRLYGATPASSQPWTPEGELRLEQLSREFYLRCGNFLICKGQWRIDCALCKGPPPQEHILHATDHEWRACNDALKWLSDRTGREFVFVNGEIGHSGVTRPVTRESFTDEILRGGL